MQADDDQWLSIDPALEVEIRACGEALLEASAFYESMLIPSGAPLGIFARLGLVARQRRFLRGIHVLADAGLHLEALALFRSMLEFYIRQLWLALDPKHELMWIRADFAKRASVHTDLMTIADTDSLKRELGASDDRAWEEVRSFRDTTLEQIAKLDAEIGWEAGRPKPLPSVKEQSRAVGLLDSYLTAYQAESQNAVHPSPMAIERVIRECGEGVQFVSRESAPATSPTLAGAFCLRDALLHAATIGPQYAVDLSTITPRMEAVARSLTSGARSA